MIPRDCEGCSDGSGGPGSEVPGSEVLGSEVQCSVVIYNIKYSIAHSGFYGYRRRKSEKYPESEYGCPWAKRLPQIVNKR